MSTMKAEKNETDEEPGAPPLAQKVAFLRSADAYPRITGAVTTVETHMSWVFLAGDRAYKLKRPLQLPYLDFSTLAKREAACRAELKLNRRLAPELYLAVAPLRETTHGLSLAGDGRIVDWLVVMHRVNEQLMLDAEISAHRVDMERLRALENILGRFYRHAQPVFAPPEKYLRTWHQLLRSNRLLLLDSRLSMPTASVLMIDRAQRRFLARFGSLLVHRLQHQKIVEGHGDLRPEHIWLGRPLSIIDCLEFNAEFRSVDPFDELSSLAIECERLDAPDIGNGILKSISRMLSDGVVPELLTFYRCYRATLRANLSIAHLLDSSPRTPAKWRPLALRYLEIARREAVALNAFLNRQADRPAAGSDGGAGWLARTNRQRPICRSSAKLRRPTDETGEQYR